MLLSTKMLYFVHGAMREVDAAFCFIAIKDVKQMNECESFLQHFSLSIMHFLHIILLLLLPLLFVKRHSSKRHNDFPCIYVFVLFLFYFSLNSIIILDTKTQRKQS